MPKDKPTTETHPSIIEQEPASPPPPSYLLLFCSDNAAPANPELVQIRVNLWALLLEPCSEGTLVTTYLSENPSRKVNSFFCLLLQSVICLARLILGQSLGGSILKWLRLSVPTLQISFLVQFGFASH